MTLSEFLLARLAEDEVEARVAGGEDWLASEVPGPTMRKSADQEVEWIIDSGPHLVAHVSVINSEGSAQHIARHSPARVLANVAAKRLVLLEHRPHDADSGSCRTCSVYESCGCVNGPSYPCPTLLALASSYADYPDFDEAWRV